MFYKIELGIQIEKKTGQASRLHDVKQYLISDYWPGRNNVFATEIVNFPPRIGHYVFIVYL